MMSRQAKASEPPARIFLTARPLNGTMVVEGSNTMLQTIELFAAVSDVVARMPGAAAAVLTVSLAILFAASIAEALARR